MKCALLLLSMFVAIPAAGAVELGVVSGGPDRLSASLSRLESAVQVCFATGRSSRAVKVKVTVARDGQVVAASPVDRGAVAQCVAGVLAVQSLSPARRRYAAVIQATPGSGSIARLRAAVDAVRPEVDQCLRRVAGGKGMRGKLAVRFVITPDGKATNAAITEDTIKRRAARECLTRPIRAARFPTPPNRRPLEYTLPIAVDIAPAGGRSSRPSTPR